MAVTNVVRNLRDGALVIKDGSSPVKSCTIYCDGGDLRWTERYEEVVTRCRGAISTRRPGDDQECELSFTVKWTNFINYSVDGGSAAIQPYEFINFLDGDFTSTSTGLNTLDYEFTVTDPEGDATELCVFPDVFCTELSPSEGEENSFSFSGRSSAVRPTITQP